MSPRLNYIPGANLQGAKCRSHSRSSDDQARDLDPLRSSPGGRSVLNQELSVAQQQQQQVTTRARATTDMIRIANRPSRHSIPPSSSARAASLGVVTSGGGRSRLMLSAIILECPYGLLWRPTSEHDPQRTYFTSSPYNIATM
jgi:hypothetical protein